MVKSGDNSHYNLEDRRMEEFEVIENVGVLLRLRLKDKTPPCVIKFKPTTPNATFKVFYSEILKEPDEFDNHGSEVNVRTRGNTHKTFLSKLTIFCFSVTALKDSARRYTTSSRWWRCRVAPECIH